MALSYNLDYQESISVHPTRRQNFAGKPYSTFWNIWEWVICTLTTVWATQCMHPSIKQKSSENYGIRIHGQEGSRTCFSVDCWVLFGDFVYIQWLLSLVPRWCKAEPDGSKLPPTKKTRSRRSAKMPNYAACATPAMQNCQFLDQQKYRIAKSPSGPNQASC